MKQLPNLPKLAIVVLVTMLFLPIILPGTTAFGAERSLDISSAPISNKGSASYALTMPDGEDITASFTDPGFLAVIRKKIDKPEGPILDTDVASMKELNVDSWYTSGITIVDLSGIEHFTSLTHLYCEDQQLQELDLSKNLQLQFLSCAENKLTKLDISKNSELQELYCRENRLRGLDISQNLRLEKVNCGENPLGVLDISNNLVLRSLACWSCELTELDISANTLLEYVDCEENDLTALDLSKNTILRELKCSENRLASLDIAKNTALERLECGANLLAALTISSNTKLEVLYCNDNDLDTLDISHNPALVLVNCSANQLPALDISRNQNLEQLYCGNNQLDALSTNQNPKLRELNCSDNQLPELNISQNPLLELLFCNENLLTAIDITNNSHIYYMECQWNYMNTPNDVRGWQGLDLTVNSPQSIDTGSFRFYMQYNMATVTYTAQQRGGVSNTTTSTGITLTFSEDISGLTAAHISISNGTGAGAGAATKGTTLSSVSANTWVIELAGVATQGRVNVSIADFAEFLVLERIQEVTVYKEKINPPGGDPPGGGGSPSTFKVTFNSNGGSEVPSQTVESGKKAIKPADPTKEDCAFAGWYSNSALTTEYDFNKTVTGNLTLYAKWIELDDDDKPPLGSFISFNPFIEGFEDNTFRGDSLITREQFVTILYRLKNAASKPQADKNSPTFKDVSPLRWSYNAIEWAYGAKIIAPDSAGNFYPAEPLARSDMAEMLAKADKLSKIAENIFSDIDDHPQRDYILMAVEVGILIGYPDHTFQPQGNTTRYEATKALICYLLHGEPEDEMWQDLNITLSDVSVDHWAYKYIVLAVNGYSGYLPVSSKE